jgi:hypothetical protein
MRCEGGKTNICGSVAGWEMRSGPSVCLYTEVLSVTRILSPVHRISSRTFFKSIQLLSAVK